MLDCDNSWSDYGPWRGTNIGADSGGWVRQLDDGETPHILSLILCTESLFYSVSKSNGSTECEVMHDGQLSSLSTISDGPVEPFPAISPSTYGYEGSYAKLLSVDLYYDEVLDQLIFDPEKLNPVLGQYVV